jgi:purine nucleosidase
MDWLGRAKPMPLIIDCDPGVDDAIALLLTFAAPELELLGISVVAGNVPLSVTAANARRICELAGRSEMPVYAGCPRPLLGPQIGIDAGSGVTVTAAEVHGETGLVGVELPAPQMALQPEHAVSWLIQTLSEATAPITIATLGPLTNLAVALTQSPHILPKIRQIVMMGGAITHGNITPKAEFNIYCDPHAAQIVLASGCPITLVSLDVTHSAIATPERIERLRAIGEPLGPIVAAWLKAYGAYDEAKYGFSGPPIHDACVIAYLLAPDAFTSRPCPVSIELTSPAAIGQTIVDWWGQAPSQNPAVNVLTAIDADRFYALLVDRLTHLNSRLQLSVSSDAPPTG